MYEDLLYKSTGGIATITLNRPEKLNAFRGQTIVEMTQALRVAARDRSVGVIVITGAGDKAFCVGGDIQEMKGLNRRTGRLFVKRLVELARAFLTSPKPIIAKVNGYCLGGGNEIQLFCDLTIASEKSVFSQVGARVGSAPLWGGTQILPLVVGLKRAHEIIYFCRQYPAREAKEIGMINAVVPEIGLDALVEKHCRELLEKSPQSLALSRRSLHEGLLVRIQKDLNRLTKIYGSLELKEGMSAFLEKRTPEWGLASSDS